MVQGFIFEGDLQFSKLFNMTQFEKVCAQQSALTNVSSLLPPSISSLNLSPIQNSKEALPMARRKYSIVHISKNFRLSAPCPLYSSHPLSPILLYTKKEWARESPL
jgi:hypothetical protein